MQSLLARDVRSYMRVRGQGDEAEAHELLSLCSVLARFLSQLLEGNEKWSRYQWVDDVLPSLAAVVSHEELSVLGLMIWGEKGQARQWVSRPRLCGGLILKTGYSCSLKAKSENRVWILSDV